MNRIWQVENFSKFIKGKHGFLQWGNTKKNLIPCLARKVDQYWSRVYQKMQNSNILGGMFPKKSWFCQYFHEIVMILDFWDYIEAPIRCSPGSPWWRAWGAQCPSCPPPSGSPPYPRLEMGSGRTCPCLLPSGARCSCQGPRSTTQGVARGPGGAEYLISGETWRE